MSPDPVRQKLADAVIETARKQLLDDSVPLEKRRGIVRGGVAAVGSGVNDTYTLLMLGIAIMALAVDEVLANPEGYAQLSEALAEEKPS